MSIEIQLYFAEGERYPALIGVRAEGDEYETAYVSKSELVDALAENHKLRELIRDLWKACPADGYYCIHHCEHYDKESESHCKLIDRMRELGVEVDDD